MAKKHNDTSEEKPVLSNGAARTDRINSGFEKLYRLKREKEALEVEHLTEVKDAIKKEWRDLKADVDLAREDLKIGFAAYERSKLAETMESEDDSGRVHDALQEVFMALQKGQQLDWLSALGEG